MLTVNFAKIVGTAKERQWSQVHTFVPKEERLEALGIKIFTVALKIGEDQDREKPDLSSLGKEVIQRFHERYYGSGESTSAGKHLEESLAEVRQEFESAVSEIIVGILLPAEDAERAGRLYLARCGAGGALLTREGKTYQLMGGEPEGALEKIETVSGWLEEGDMLLVGTSGFFALLSEKILVEALASGSADEAGLILAPSVHGTSDNSLAAAVVSKVEKAEAAAQIEADSDEGERKDAESAKEAVTTQKGRLFAKLGKVRAVKERIGQELRQRRSGWLEEDIRVKGEKQKKSKLMFSVAFSVLLLLLVSVIFGYRQRVSEERNKNYSALTEIVEHQYAEAATLTELNPLRARALLTEAKQAVEQALGEGEKKFSESQNRDLARRLEEIKTALTAVSGERRLESAGVFLDLNLVREGSYGERLGLYEKTMVVLDRGSGVLLKVNLDSKASETVGGGNLLDGAKLAAATAGRAFVLAAAGVVEVSLAGRTSALVVETDPEWGEVVEIETFAGNLYLLDKGQGEIFRYPGSEDGFGKRDRWLGEGVLPDFSGAVGMAIDGDIWVLNGQTVSRFRRGVEEPFSLKGLEKPFSEPTAIYTDAESERVYILDRGNRRVVVFDKNGDYKNQYLWEGIGTVSDLVVNEGLKKMYLLSGKNIFEIGLEADR